MAKRDAPERPFDIDEALEQVAVAVRDVPKAAMFELAEAGHASVFEQLVACLISTRTYDETTLVVARRLFAAAPTPEAMAALAADEIDALIQPCTFHEPKARQIAEIARRTTEEYGGALPGSYEVLTSFHGIGPKCANLVLGVACGESKISVDVHVHRITNRWGYVATKSPEQTLSALEKRLPKRHWIEINRLLVPFGKHVCTGVRPRCSTCPVRPMCPRIGVGGHR